jgi:hypothetical protein
MANGIFQSVGVTSFPVVPNPSAGTFYFGIDSTDGHFKVQNSAGLVTDYQSGASYSDADAVLAIQNEIIAETLKLDPDSNDFMYLRDVAGNDFNTVRKIDLQRADPDRLFQLHSDFIGTAAGEFTQYISGTGASVQTGTYGQDATNNAMGVTQVDAGTTATGRAGLGLISGAVFRPTIGQFNHCARLALEALSSPTETFTVRTGIGDFYTLGTDGTNGLFFRYTDLVNGGRWQAVSRAGGADLNVVDTGVSPDLDHHIYEVDLAEDGTTCLYKIDGALVATISTPNLPGISNAMGAGFQIVKSIGTTQRNLSADWMIMRFQRSTAR